MALVRPLPIMVGHALIDLATAAQIVATSFVLGLYQTMCGQKRVMLVLWEQDKQPVCDIAKKLLLDTNTVTPLLQRMEKAGFISRTKGKEDTRQRIVSLTKKGKALQEKAKPIPDCLLNDVALKTGEEEEMLKMIPTLDKLIEGLKRTKK